MSRLPDLAEAKEALIIKPSSLGDVLHTLPAVFGLKKTWPHLSLRWIVNTEWSPVLAGNSSLTEIVPFPRREFRGPIGSLRALRWMSGLKRLQPDVALDFQGLLRSALIARASRARFVAGMSDAREGAKAFYSLTVPVDGGAHAVERCWSLARAFGVAGAIPNVAGHLPAGDPVPDRLPERFILLHPFARGGGKSLNDSQVMALASALTPWPVVLAGMTAGDRTPRPPVENLIDLTNRTSLSELIWLMRRAEFVISVDSGPMHLASALDRPLLAIHTWSDPRKVGPYATDARIWKGGRIVRRIEIDDALAAESRPPNDADLQSIAGFVIERLPARRQ